MEDAGTGAGHRAPPSVLRRLALGQRVAGRAVSHARVADAVLRRRTPKLLSAATRIAPPTEVHGLATPWVASPAPAISAERDPVRWVPETPGAPAALAPTAPAPGEPQALSEEASTFRSLMKRRYDMPDETFDALFGGNTPVYRGFMPTIPPAPGPAEDADGPADVPSPTDPAAVAPGSPPSSPPAARSPRPTQAGPRGAQILEGARGSEPPGPPLPRPPGRAGKRLSTRPPGTPTPPAARATSPPASAAARATSGTAAAPSGAAASSSGAAAASGAPAPQTPSPTGPPPAPSPPASTPRALRGPTVTPTPLSPAPPSVAAAPPGPAAPSAASGTGHVGCLQRRGRPRAPGDRHGRARRHAARRHAARRHAARRRAARHRGAGGLPNDAAPAGVRTIRSPGATRRHRRDATTASRDARAGVSTVSVVCFRGESPALS